MYLNYHGLLAVATKDCIQITQCPTCQLCGGTQGVQGQANVMLNGAAIEGVFAGPYQGYEAFKHNLAQTLRLGFGV